MLISEMLHFEHIWVWLDFRFYYESKLLILCSLSCSVAVVRLEGSFGHATRRMSWSCTQYCASRHLHQGEPQLSDKNRFTVSRVLGHNADTDTTIQLFQTVGLYTYKLTARTETKFTQDTVGLKSCNFRERIIIPRSDSLSSSKNYPTFTEQEVSFACSLKFRQKGTILNWINPFWISRYMYGSTLCFPDVVMVSASKSPYVTHPFRVSSQNICIPHLYYTYRMYTHHAHLIFHHLISPIRSTWRRVKIMDQVQLVLIELWGYVPHNRNVQRNNVERGISLFSKK
jgi:hypothetical protein